jgi:hypothetical protein
MPLPLSLAELPPGQRRVAETLVGGSRAPTYDQVADALGLHGGTVLSYLNRIRVRRPDVYADLMVRRGRQFGELQKLASRANFLPPGVSFNEPPPAALRILASTSPSHVSALPRPVGSRWTLRTTSLVKSQPNTTTSTDVRYVIV